MSRSKKSLWVVICATTIVINMEDFYFLACPHIIDDMRCMKKAVQHSNNMWNCTKCNDAFLECDYHYVLCLEFHDHTDHLENVISFDDVVIELFGVISKDHYLLSSKPKFVRDISTEIKCHHFFFTLSIKTNTFIGVECLGPALMHSEELPYGSTPTLVL